MKRTPLFFLIILACLSLSACATVEPSQTDDGMLKACEASRATLQAERDRLTAERDKLTAQNAELAELLNERASILEQLRTRLEAQLKAGALTLSTRNGLIVITLPNSVLFETGKAKVNDEGARTIREVANALKGINERRFMVSGHTDNVPIKAKNDAMGSNWELSTRRGQSVLNIMLEAGLPTSTVAVAGFGEFDPVAPNDSDEGKAMNRRTEIVLLPNLEAILKVAKK